MQRRSLPSGSDKPEGWLTHGGLAEELAGAMWTTVTSAVTGGQSGPQPTARAKLVAHQVATATHAPGRLRVPAVTCEDAEGVVSEFRR